MPSSEYKELLKRKAELDAQTADALEQGKPAAIEQCRDLIAAYGLSTHDLFGKPEKPGKGGKGQHRGPVAAKYRHPDTGQTWSGRGKPPAWIGEDREQYRIAA